MSELRLNLITREWVVIATERAQRPDEFIRDGNAPLPDACVKGCPFCPGEEAQTPGEIMRIEGDAGWLLRVVPNKFAALSEAGDRQRHNSGRKHSIGGYGRHEVIIETPVHNRYIAHMQLEEVERLIQAYKARFAAIYQDADVEHVIIFKNHGEAAGTSLQHPHSQIIGTPVTPMQVRDRLDAGRRYFDDTGECLMCASLSDELEDGARVILDSEHFVTFIPYAALSPFHLWIFPRRHCACFADINDNEVADLARHLQQVLARLYGGLDNPSFNYVIRSESPRASGAEYFHWYISLVPRLSQPAGFELGSGMYINASIPEESAGFLRNVQV
ncbi:MAG: galactose-1-phosphate uridylyltransferase [Mariprofundaceae bacterium]